MYVTVEELRAQSNIPDFGEDEYLSSLIETAEASVEEYIQQPLTNKTDESGKLNPMLKHAIKILAATFYDNREAVSFGQPNPVPYTLDFLLLPHRAIFPE